MIELMLPGRSPESEDYEAQCSLRTLLEAHKILSTKDEELFDRIRKVISHNQEFLDHVEEMLSSGEEEAVANLFDGPKDRGDTRTMDDFFNRLNRSRSEERAKNLTPIKKGVFG